MPSLYLIAGTVAAVELEALVQNNIVRKVIATLSEEHQIFKEEAFHSLMNHFPNKISVYS